MLADDKSRQILEVWINQKITGSFRYLSDFCDSNQYFDEIVDFSRANCFVDCGAYQGDSYLAFVNNYEKQVGKNYAGTAYLWEPNRENIDELHKNLKDYNYYEVMPKGSSINSGILYFSGNDSNGII